MALPPAWKVKRELRRVYENLLDFVRFRPAVEWLRILHYEVHPRINLHETQGALLLTARVAVFVLFQPKGIAGSTLQTLAHLAEEGWSVLVISNAPLSPDDRTRVATNSAHVIERPNLGYDFGAYREGWRWLQRRGHRPNRLILMNDSTWFPLRRQDDTLRRMEALKVDLAGHIFKTESSADSSNDHMESHLLMFGQRALAHPDIQEFWANYRMTSSKALTIERGEKGISQAVLLAGLELKGLLDREQLLSILGGLPDDALCLVASNLVIDDDENRQRRADWVAAAAHGLPWREDFLAWTDYELANSLYQLLSATFVYPAILYGGMGFMKKSNDRRFQLARMLILREIEAGCIPPFDPVIMEEVRSNAENWKEHRDWRRDPHKKPEPLVL
jgi:hypothetical protein